MKQKIAAMLKSIQCLIDQRRKKTKFDDVLEVLNLTVKLAKNSARHELFDKAISGNISMYMECLPKFDLGRQMGHTTALNEYAKTHNNVIIIVRSYSMKRWYDSLNYAENSFVMTRSEFDIWTLGNHDKYTILVECAPLNEEEFKKIGDLIMVRAQNIDVVVLVQPR